MFRCACACGVLSATVCFLFFFGVGGAAWKVDLGAAVALGATLVTRGADGFGAADGLA